MSNHLTDAQYAAFIDRLVACREAEDAAKEDTKLVYAELAEAGEDKTAAGLIVRGLRMSAKDRVKANLRDAAVESGFERYNRGKASHVRAREADPEHDADGVIIEPTTTNGGSRETAAHPQSHVNPGRRRNADSGNGPDVAAAQTGELQRQVISETNHELAEGSAEETSAPNSIPAQDSSGTQQGKSNAALPASVDASVSDDVSGVERSNITPLHRHNPATHFLSSKGLPRLHGCRNPEACGGSHRALCFSCSVAHDGPAYQGGAA